MLEEEMMVSQILEQEMEEKKKESMVVGYLDIKVSELLCRFLLMTL